MQTSQTGGQLYSETSPSKVREYSQKGLSDAKEQDMSVGGVKACILAEHTRQLVEIWLGFDARPNLGKTARCTTLKNWLVVFHVWLSLIIENHRACQIW